MWKRAIIHSDLNHCYAQIEEMKVPELRDVPMAVGGHEESRHGIILAKNDKAKEFGIKTGESLRDAFKKCPDLLIVHPNYDDYLYYTEQVKDIYREYSDKVESMGLDEAWIDITASQTLFGEPEKIAKTIQIRVLEELGLTVSIGLSYNKIFAKLGSDMDKHMGLTVITEDNYQEKVWPLPVGDLLYVGRATEAKLKEMGIDTIGKLANFPVHLLQKRLGKMGMIISQFANGNDCAEVAAVDFMNDPKSIGNGITAKHDLHNYQEVRMIYTVLCECVASRLKDINMRGYVVSIGLRDNELHWFSRQKKLEQATNISSEILKTAMQLVKENWFCEVPLRSVGVSVSKLEKDDGFCQLDLFNSSENREKEKKIDEAMDLIRNKYGHHMVIRGNTLYDRELTDFDPKGDHVIHPVGYFK